jgi:hypothetical protein
MRAVTGSMVLCLAALVASVPLQAKTKTTCRTVQGNLDETLIYNFGPFPRVMGSASGSLVGAETGTRTSITPSGNGFAITTQNIFVTGAGDLLVTAGAGVVTPTSADAATFVVTLTVDPALSTGRFVGATGMITLQGTGFGENLLIPGSTVFQSHYKGNLCTE